MRPRGFTLLEVLIAIAITTMVLSLFTYFAIDISTFGLNLGDRLENQRELELTLRTIVSEVRSMGPSDNGSYPIATATATAFTFYSDIDGDGKFEQVRYFLNGSILQKGVTKSTGSPATYPSGSEVIQDVVHSMVPAAVFAYYPSGHPDLTTPLSVPVDVSAVRLIKVTGTTDKDTAKPPGATTLSITITVRNLRGDI